MGPSLRKRDADEIERGISRFATGPSGDPDRSRFLQYRIDPVGVRGTEASRMTPTLFRSGAMSLEQLQPFGADAEFIGGEPRGIAAGAVPTLLDLLEPGAGDQAIKEAGARVRTLGKDRLTEISFRWNTTLTRRRSRARSHPRAVPRARPPATPRSRSRPAPRDRPRIRSQVRLPIRAPNGTRHPRRPPRECGKARGRRSAMKAMSIISMTAIFTTCTRITLTST